MYINIAHPGYNTICLSYMPLSRIQNSPNSIFDLIEEMLERGQTSLRKYLRTLGRMHEVIKGRAWRGGNQAADSILRGALESVTELGQEESAPVRGRGRARGARGGRMRRARGARAVGTHHFIGKEV